MAGKFLIDGFMFGFHIPFMGDRVASWADNLKLVKGQEDIVRQKIGKEVKEGWVLGPFPAPTVKNLRVLSLGIVPKKAPEEFRLIHHLSFLAGDSVNDRIPQVFTTHPLMRQSAWCGAVRLVHS